MEHYFPYFPHIQACPPEGITGPSPELAERVYNMFPESKTAGGNRVLLGLLYICLPQTPPFHNTADDTIRDVRYNEDRLLPCPQRSLLIKQLAVALLQYHYDCQQGERDAQALSDARKSTLRGLREIKEDFQNRRAKGALPAVGKRLPNNQTINKALQVFTEIINLISDPGQNLNTAKVTALLRLFFDMKDAFERYSPPYTFFLLNGDMEWHRNRHLF